MTTLPSPSLPQEVKLATANTVSSSHKTFFFIFIMVITQLSLIIEHYIQ